VRAKRICATSGCGASVTAGSRCPKHAREKDGLRGSVAARGYGLEHVKARSVLVAALKSRWARGEIVLCPCGEPMLPGQELHADHSRSGAASGERPDRLLHKACNLSKRYN